MANGTTSPMLAASLPCIKKAKKLGRSPTEAEILADLKKLDLQAPFRWSPKIDGIRGYVREGVVYSRTWKPIPNVNVQEKFGKQEFSGLDGELTLGHHSDLTSYNDNQSAIMTEQGPRDIFFNVFDRNPDVSTARFFHRTMKAEEVVKQVDMESMVYVDHGFAETLDDIFAAEESVVMKGYEGLMLRHPQGLYKLGRSTFIEQGLIKLKRFEDSEAVITGFQEKMLNQNEAKIDARGFQVRSSHKDGKVGADTLGLFECRDVDTGMGFECGSGLDDSTRDLVWRNREDYLGRIIKYKFQPHGVKEKPRSPIFLGFRDERDM